MHPCNWTFIGETTHRRHSILSVRVPSKHITRLCRDDGKCPSRSLQRTQGPLGPLQQITQLKMLVISQHLALTAWAVVCMIFVALPQQQGATDSALQREVKKKHSKEKYRGSVDSCDLKHVSPSSNILSVLKISLSDPDLVRSVMLTPDWMHAKVITYHCNYKLIYYISNSTWEPSSRAKSHPGVGVVTSFQGYTTELSYGNCEKKSFTHILR